MLGIRFCAPTVSGLCDVIDQANAGRPISNSLRYSSSPSSFQLGFRTRKSHKAKSFLIFCEASRGSFGGNSESGEEGDHEYLEAFVLVSETIRHYQLHTQGFLEDRKWHSSSQLLPFHSQERGSKAEASSIGNGFLRRFPSPTIFLKIACDGDLLLPIIVGEFAIEKLIDAFKGDDNLDSPNQFHFVRNLVGKLGYEVKMVRITRRVVNTYYSRIYIGKPGEKAILSVDARPSDAINVAKRCKVPIYVRKQIVLTDAVRFVYGKQRENASKSVYDVSLDSAVEGPDLLAEEIDLVRNMNIAVKDERYKDAAMWRDKLTKLRTSRHELGF